MITISLTRNQQAITVISLIWLFFGLYFGAIGYVTGDWWYFIPVIVIGSSIFTVVWLWAEHYIEVETKD